MQADMKLLLFLPAAQAHPLQVIDVAPGHDAAAVWSAACKRTESRMDFAAPLLLLPEGYSLLPGDKVQQASHASHPGVASQGFCRAPVRGHPAPAARHMIAAVGVKPMFPGHSWFQQSTAESVRCPAICHAPIPQLLGCQGGPGVLVCVLVS